MLIHTSQLEKRYIKLFMLDAGIDVTVYSNHSLRKASTSKANNIGLTSYLGHPESGWMEVKGCIPETLQTSYKGQSWK